MTVLVYAEASDVATWTGATAPANANTLIRVASSLVRRATMCAAYDVDDDGAPTDTDVAAVFCDAVCAQVATWAALVVDPVKGAADAATTVAAKSLGSAQIQYAVYASTVEARARAATRLCDEALMILADAALTTPRAVTLR